jgi:uncharacterized protein
VISAVIDTNVLASGFIGFATPASTPGAIVRAWRDGQFELVVSEPIIAELEHTFQDPYFTRRLSDQDRLEAVTLLRTQAVITAITVSVQGVATHPEDDVILATAVSYANHTASPVTPVWLVTGDKQLQKLGTYQEVPIVSPPDFLTVLSQQP